MESECACKLFWNIGPTLVLFTFEQARSKPSEGGGHVNQKGSSGPKTPTLSAKNGHSQGKNGQKPSQKAPSAQKGQVKAPQKNPPNSKNKKNKKGKHQTYDLVVTIDLVSKREH